MPLCLLSFIYLRIFFVARKNSRKIRRKNTSSVRMNAEALSGNVEYDEDGGGGDNPEMEMSSINGVGPNQHFSVGGMRKASYEFSISFGKENGGAQQNQNERRKNKKKREVSVPSMSCPAAVLDETSLNQLTPPQQLRQHRAPKLKGTNNGHASLDATASCPAEAVKKRRLKKPKLRYNKSLASSASSKESCSVDSSTCSLTPTPKRKCSFSSYSECRLVEESEGGGAAKHQGYCYLMRYESVPSVYEIFHSDSSSFLSSLMRGPTLEKSIECHHTDFPLLHRGAVAAAHARRRPRALQPAAEPGADWGARAVQSRKRESQARA